MASNFMIGLPVSELEDLLRSGLRAYRAGVGNTCSAMAYEAMTVAGHEDRADAILVEEGEAA